MRLISIVLPYLLLVSFYSGTITNFGMEKIKAINESSYDGVAVMLIGAYDTGNHSEKEFVPAVKLLKKEAKKHIWPWIFLNRFIGYKEEGKSLSSMANKEYFRNINGMDIYNELGALEDFKNIFKISLIIAKELGSPGIVVDPEAYNNYRNYDISYLSKQLGKSEEEVEKRLKQVGAELVDIAEKEYPDAIIWFLFTGLGSPERTLNPFADKKYRTVTYIVQGMLERAKEKSLKLKFVSGGGSSLGYCYESLDDLKKQIKQRENQFREVITRYQNLHLGGTIALWHDVRLKQKGYFTKGKCRKSNLKNIEDFKPLVKCLLKSYQYVWVYAAMDVGYNPYDKTVALPYNNIIKDIMDKRF